MSQNEFSPADTIETDAAPEAQPNAEAPANEALAEILLRKRKNGLSLAEAIEFALAHEALPAVELAWEKPLADTENMRLRKIQTAQALAGTFGEARDVLSRPAGTITTARWTPAWQRDAEKAVREFSASAETLSASAADFTAATGLLPLAGTLKEFRALLGLVGALIAVRDEDSALVLGADAAEKLSALREAATLSENLGRHESLLSLPYSENAAESPALEPLLKTWREAENARAFPRWVKRRKVVRALRELAGGTKQKPLDPRVDLGNLIAVRTCRGELAEKFSELAKAFPSLVGIAGALPRIEALEKARAAVVAALERLENFPEKREAWNTVIARWLAGTDPAFERKPQKPPEISRKRCSRISIRGKKFANGMPPLSPQNVAACAHSPKTCATGTCPPTASKNFSKPIIAAAGQTPFANPNPKFSTSFPKKIFPVTKNSARSFFFAGTRKKVEELKS